jgi:hypothetical protein
MSDMSGTVTTFEGAISGVRFNIKESATYIKSLIKQAKEAAPANWPVEADAGEIIANLTLSYRHLEDAAMRLGKVIQAHDGGKSIYDK